MKIAVTGVTGYIGERFAKRAFAAGHQIVALSRQPPGSVVSYWIPYELSSNQAPALPIDTDVVLHLATYTSPDAQQESAQEVLAAELLIKATQDVGARFVFVSSQTARPDAPTAYGRTKWRIEQQVLTSGGWVVRPGQVYGGVPRGLFGELVTLVQTLPVLPAFLPSPKVQPIHVDDLTVGLLRIAQRDDIHSKLLCVAASEPVTFTGFLSAIARHRLRVRRGYIPVPAAIISVCLPLIREPLQRQLGLDRFRSLFDLPVMDTASDLKRLDLQLRPLTSGMHPAADDGRRRLLIEGQTLLSYVLRAQASSALLRRYVRAIEKLRGGKALALWKPFVRRPALLALVDGSKRTETIWEKEFVWRLDAATVLAEATPSGARRFLGLGEPYGFVWSIFRITRAVTAEVGWRILSVLLAPVTRVVCPRSSRERR